MSADSATQKYPVDILTAIGIGLLLTSLQITFHEGIHALTCMILGDQLHLLSALHVECTHQSIVNDKLVAFSAVGANIILGLILLIILRNSQGRQPITRLLIWMFMLMNFLAGTGYFMFSGIANIGDISVVIDGWQPAGLWRILVALIGTGGFLLSIFISLKEMGKIIGGSDLAEQVGRLSKIGVFTYIGSILAAVAAGFMNPEGITGLPAIAGIIGIAGGASPLLWMAQWFRAKSFDKSPSTPVLMIERHWGVIVAGVVASLIYAIVFGPGISF